MIRLRKTLAPSLLASLALLASAGTARANGRFPAANQLVASHTDPSFLVLRTTFGILFSHDQGTTWDWICEKGVGYGGVEDPAMGITSSGVIAGIFAGLAVSPDQGCSWNINVAKSIADVVVRYDDPRAAYAITSAYAGSGDAGETLFTSDVYGTKDDGASWTLVGSPLDPDILLTTIEVSKSDPHRLYVAGVKTSADPDAGAAPDAGEAGDAGDVVPATVTTFVFMASADDGVHYTQYAIDADPRTERAPYISAVDPTNPDRVYLRIKGVNGSRVVATDDGGKTFRTVFTAQGDLLGFALSEDGSKVYTGGPLDGVQVASKTDLAFTKKADIQVQCLTAIGSTLWACSNEASGFVLGTSVDDGATFTAKMHLGCMRGPLACPPTASTAQCAADYPALQQSLAVGISCDVPQADASVDAGGGSGGGPPSGCSCSFPPGGAPALGGGIAGAAAAIALFARKRKRRARR